MRHLAVGRPRCRRQSRPLPRCSAERCSSPSGRGRGSAAAGSRFVPAGLLFGGSYVSLFEAYYRGRVTVVAPLVAIESLAGVALSALLLRRSELVGKRLVVSAALIVAGGALIGAFR